METKVCQNCKKDFIIEAEDFDFYAKISVPAPSFCPECRNIQRMATRNVKSLYKRACDKCRKIVISRFSPHNTAKMYCHECWFNDDWDPLTYEKEYDFSKSFFEQFKELLFSVPHVSLLNSNMVRSDYSNMETDDKDCYLTFGGHYNEDCAFTEYSVHGREVYDSYWAFNCEQCLGNINVEKCYRTFFSRECSNCTETYFSYDCRGCTDIIGCAGLRNKSYCIFNKQYDKKEYTELKSKFNFGSQLEIDDLKSKSEEIWQQSPHRSTVSIQAVNSTGNDIFYAKNATNAWQVENVENVKNMYIVSGEKDCYDETSVASNELCYMSANGGGMYNCKAVLYSFTADVMNKKHCYNSEYSYTLLNSSYCFGCVGVRKKEYCILNKQYSKEEYENLLPRIIQHMQDMPYISKTTDQVFRYGDFFPGEHALFAYNETVAHDFYPLLKGQAEKSGFTWREELPQEYEPTGYTIPDNILNVKDDILDAVLECKHTGKAYKITKRELEFYRKMSLPVPQVAPFQRIKERIEKLLPFKLWHRSCMCDKQGHGHLEECQNSFETPYAPERPEIVYCEQCYQKEIM